MDGRGSGRGAKVLEALSTHRVGNQGDIAALVSSFDALIICDSVLITQGSEINHVSRAEGASNRLSSMADGLDNFWRHRTDITSVMSVVNHSRFSPSCYEMYTS